MNIQKDLRDQQTLERNITQCAKQDDLDQKTSSLKMKEPLDQPSIPDINYFNDNSFHPASQERELNEVEGQCDAEYEKVLIEEDKAGRIC